MIRFVIPALIALLGLGGGVGAAIYLRDRPVPVGEIEEHRPPCGDIEGNTGQVDPAHHGDAAGGEGMSDSEYTEMGEQFVVPVVQEGRVKALVVLSLSVETAPGFGIEIQAHAPKLRDVFLRELLNHSNQGGFEGTFTSNGTMDRLNTALREAGRNTMGDQLRDVLILDINRQELG